MEKINWSLFLEFIQEQSIQVEEVHYLYETWEESYLDNLSFDEGLFSNGIMAPSDWRVIIMKHVGKLVS